MYWLIGTVNPFIEKLNNNLHSQDFLRDFESLDAHTYYNSNYQQKYDNDNEYNDSSTLNDFSSINDSFQPKNIFHLTSKDAIISLTKTTKNNHSVAYSRLIKLLDIISIIIIIISVGINIEESNQFFRINKPTRIIGVLLLNYIQDYPNNNAWDSLINSDFNISEMLFYQNDISALKMSISNYTNNSMNTGIGYYSNITNADLILAYNITPSIYNYKDNLSFPFHDFTIPLKSNKQIQKYRQAMIVFCCLLVIISFFSHYFNYLLHKANGINHRPFYRTQFLYLFIFDLVIFTLFPYPNLLSYHYFEYSSRIKCFPYSIYFSMIVNFRLLYLIKLLKFSFWNSDRVKEKCSKYQIKHSLIFVFKCFETSHPFFLILCIMCCFALVFGLNIRLSEIYYWDTQLIQQQNWEFYFNSLWFIATTMMSLGYGDIYPRTHLGRFFTIFVCISGIYVVTMVMVSISKLSVLNKNEEKVYTLIKRLNFKSQIKEEHSLLIYYSIQSVIFKRKKKTKSNINDNQSTIHDEFRYKRMIHNCLIKKTVLQREMKKFDFVPNQEMIMDLIEKLENDIKEIDKEVYILQKINNSVTDYLDSLKKIKINIKHSVISTKQLFNLIDKSNHTFGKLHNYDRRVLIEEFGFNYSSNKSLQKYFENQKNEDSLNITERRRTNPNQFENFIKKAMEEGYNNNNIQNNSLSHNNPIDNSYKNSNCILGDYEVTDEEFVSHFQHLFFESSSHVRKKPYMKYNSFKKTHHKKLYTDQIFKKIKNNVSFAKIEETDEGKEIKKSDERLNTLE